MFSILKKIQPLTYALLLLNLVAWGSIAYMQQPRAALTQAQKLFPQLSNTQPTRIVWQTSQRTRTLQRTGNVWELTTPFTWQLNEHALRPLLGALQRAPARARFPAQGEDLTRYGLAQPEASVTLHFEAGLPARTYRIGSVQNIGGALYVLDELSSEIILTSTAWARTWLSADTSSWFNQQLLNEQGGQTTELVFKLSSPALTLRIMRSHAGTETAPGNQPTWQFENPLRTPAKTGAINRVLSSVYSLRAERFVENPEATLHLPILRITLVQASGSPQTLILGQTNAGAETPYTHGQLEGYSNIFEVDAAFIKNITENWEVLRATQLTTLAGINPASITGIRYQVPGATHNNNNKNKNNLGDNTDAAENERANIFTTYIFERLENQTWRARTQPAAPQNNASQEATQPSETLANNVPALLNALQTAQVAQFVSDAPTQTDLANWGLTNLSGAPHTLSFEMASAASTPGAEAVHLHVGSALPATGNDEDANGNTSKENAAQTPAGPTLHYVRITQTQHGALASETAPAPVYALDISALQRALLGSGNAAKDELGAPAVTVPPKPSSKGKR